MLLRLLLAAALAVGLSSAAQAQTATVVSGCGSAQPNAGPGQQVTMNGGGALCVDTVVQGTAVYRGGTITTAGTSQPLMGANPNRRGWTFQNQTTGDCYWKIGAAAAANQTSYRVGAGLSYETPAHHTSTGAINVVCAVAGGYYSTEF